MTIRGAYESYIKGLNANERENLLQDLQKQLDGAKDSRIRLKLILLLNQIQAIWNEENTD